MEIVCTLCLWMIRVWMALVVGFFFLAVYLLFFADPESFDDGSLTPNSPLWSRLLALGVMCSLFFLGLVQHVLFQRKLRALP